MSNLELYIPWDKIDKDTVKLITKLGKYLIKENISLENLHLLIPCRGGEIIGSLVKNALGLPESQVTRVKITNSLYTQAKINEVDVNEYDQVALNKLISKTKQNPNLRILFIDDLVDSGGTIKYIRELFKKQICIGTLYVKECAISNLVDFYAQDLKNDWIVFPWEKYYS